jgi:hypothetical protein
LPFRAGGGGGGLGDLLKTGAAKKKKGRHHQKDVGFCEKLPKSEEQDKESPANCMRELDTMKLHRPTQKEREFLGISEAMERVNCHLLRDVMEICGGRRGMRFSNQELRDLVEILATLSVQFAKVQPCFIFN